MESFLRKEKTDSKKSDIVATVVIVAVSLVMMFLIKTGIFQDQGSDIISRELRRRGLSVDGIEFTKVEKSYSLYHASRPVVMADGTEEEYWKVYSSNTGCYHWVFPYQSDALQNKPVTVNIVFTPEEYADLLERAGSEEVDTFLKSQVLG